MLPSQNSFYARLVSSPLLLFVLLQLRHILTGWVPQITFTKDKAHSWLNFRLVENLFHFHVQLSLFT